MTDFSREKPFTVAEDRPIEHALQDMMIAGVRSMVVVKDDLVTGLITSYDIQGERPLQFLRESTYSRHDEIEVRHVMTPLARVPTLDWRFVRRAEVGQLSDYLERVSATHVLIVERGREEEMSLRGVISRARLERQLGKRFV